MILFDPNDVSIRSGWYTWLRPFMKEFAQYGGNVLLLPPPYRTTWYGPNSPSIGYDPVSVTEWGQWEEMRGGTAIEAQELSLVAARFGLRMMFDLPGQYGGYPVTERNAKGEPDKTLAYQPPSIFEGKRDGSFEQGEAFGLPIKLEYGLPRGYSVKLRLQAIQYMMECIGALGPRLDKAKDIWPVWQRLVSAMCFAIGEYYSGSNAEVVNYCKTTRNKAFDFGSHFAYRAISQNNDLTALVRNERLCHAMPGSAMSFVDNHDTDGANGVIRAKGWAYFDAATENALGFCIFGKDYWTYGLAPLIRNYMWIHQKLCFGQQQVHISQPDLYVKSRDGNGGSIGRSKGVLCGISTHTAGTRWVWTTHPFGPNTELQNYAVSGGPNVWTNSSGWVCIPIPPNIADRCDNAVAYGPVGQSGPIQTKAVTLKLRDPKDYSCFTVKL